MPGIAARVAPYSSQDKLAKLDGRLKEARLVRETRAELLAHVGNNPSVVQRAMIEQLIQLRLRLAVMDRKFAQTGAQTDCDSRTYLAWANSYGRLLERLGVHGIEPPGVGLTDYLGTRGVQRGQPAQRLPAGAREAAD